MPVDPLTRKITARGNVNAPSAIPIEDFHGAAREGVTKMAGMKMAFMPYSGGECASQYSDLCGFVKLHANRLTAPTRHQGIWQRFCRNGCIAMRDVSQHAASKEECPSPCPQGVVAFRIIARWCALPSGFPEARHWVGPTE
jgi:hypothetical protein